ncbi:hypothetical protein COU14_01130 [Candidatus Kaiserbacteria bacterium CG10_big_fil_rev_8_21_14_0_10_44_10]|uniref:Uncharacterized protein n=1 Tax=Candidatus Kaiserbacteria bacterium CG10_big_fil_rev_8_21_14_0_10_44_10 TaxID=1974606 RepID=A0A2H0UI00_9BACT|nr:MAG: hypothetical protein COU14_01130 [Candidatus Kaiserbacteria bacterium CG10_big_fil_rev_8_21_14_0_10_44_10]
MESTTMFLASMWGPAILAVGIGFFVSREHYLRIYRDIQREPFALLAFGMAGIAAAIAQISVHNVWGTLPEMLISFLGWAMLLKSLAFMIMPNITDKVGDSVASKSTLVTTAGVIMLVAGGYLTWLAYMV